MNVDRAGVLVTTLPCDQTVPVNVLKIIPWHHDPLITLHNLPRSMSFSLISLLSILLVLHRQAEVAAPAQS